MIGLRLLGTAGLRDAEGVEVPLTARKRFALLAYLAVEGSRCGAPSRDEIMAVFWPDLDQARARAVLRQTLRLLRRDLGRHTLETRGSELSLCPAGIWCDAVAFDELLSAGSEAEALELYDGPLLDGFHYPRSSWAFEEWRDREARRLQERAVEALWRLVDGQGAGARSESRLRQLLRVSPYDETALRWLMRSLAGRGNRAEAVQLFESFSDRLSSDLELDPSPETEILAEAIRSGASLPPATRVPDSNGGGPVSVRPPAPARASVSAPEAPADAQNPEVLPVGAAGSRGPGVRSGPGGEAAQPRIRRTLANRLRIGTTLILVALAGWLTWRATIAPAESGGPGSTTPLVVLPFEYEGDPEHAYLAAGLASLVRDNLDGAGPLRTIDFRWEEEGPDESPDAVARRLGADLYLTGEIVEAGGRLRVRAALHGQGAQGGPEVRATVEGRAGDPFALADEIAVTLLREVSSVGVRDTRSAALTTTSLPAFHAYLEGEERLRTGDYDEAISAFEVAIREDTAFAMAYHRLAVAAEWAPRPDLMARATEAAVRHADRLPHRERSLLEASRVWRRGDAEEAERRYREILRMYPQDAEAWFQLGEVLFHHNPLRGRPIRESETAWRRVLARDPENLAALVHLARVLSAEGRLGELEVPGAVGQGQGGTRDRRILQIRALRAVDSGSGPARTRMARQIHRESDAFWVDVWYVLAFARNLEGAEPLLDLLVHPEEPTELRALGHVMRAHVRAAQGRWRDAQADLAAAERLDPAMGLAYRGYLSTLPFVPTSRSELERLRSDLLRWDADGVPASVDPRAALTIHADVWPIIRHYLLGSASVALGDFRDAEGRVRALIDLVGESAPTDPAGGTGPDHPPEVDDARELARDLARGLQARIAWRQGRPEEALDLLEGLDPRTTFDRAFLSPFHARAMERYLRAELLFELGRDDEALRWFDAMAQLSPYELAYLPLAHLRRARLHARSGDATVARDHFLRYRSLWRGADHDWREMLEDELRPTVPPPP